jgi:hypothetical protein
MIGNARATHYTTINVFLRLISGIGRLHHNLHIALSFFGAVGDVCAFRVEATKSLFFPRVFWRVRVRFFAESLRLGVTFAHDCRIISVE